MSQPSDPNAQPLTYRAAGLDLDVYGKSMAALGPLLRRTHTPRVLDLPASTSTKGKKGGFFASLFSLDYNTRLFARNYRHPVLVTCTDGVGSKLKIATLAGKFDTVGIDLVGMSVNDCICTGGEPLVFLDYLAMPKDDPALTHALMKGISDGCMEADCALVGGETAILPDFYASGDYDMAGFCVGVVERDHIVNGRGVRPGDVILGLASSGLHSNGYSLVRKVVFDRAGLKVDDVVPELGRTVGAELLEPTRIYVRAVKSVLRHYPVKRRVVHGLAHITGEGLEGNVPRVLPAKCKAVIRRGSWPIPPVFGWLQRLGPVDEAEMFRVFNMGIGFVMIVSPYYAESMQRQLCEERFPTYMIGEVREGEGGVEFV